MPAQPSPLAEREAARLPTVGGQDDGGETVQVGVQKQGRVERSTPDPVRQCLAVAAVSCAVGVVGRLAQHGAAEAHPGGGVRQARSEPLLEAAEPELVQPARARGDH